MVETEQEPESAESRIVDLFFDALMDGDEATAAYKLRQLENLDGFSIVTKCVACLLACPLYFLGLKRSLRPEPLEDARSTPR
jgi:hypothetical protein